MARQKAIQEKAKMSTVQVAKVIKEVTSFKFTKSQLLKSRKYVDRRDALSALLKDDETYSHAQVEQILENFYKGGKK
ncbi:hypothetical protein MTP04_02720 [Lysinibacillus sp. PLM2]|nr:hypothetical protein MTP04_02720 [Lysinibacillus sp. PLM2]